MSDRYCPCGARLDRSSAVRSLRSSGLRMFMSIRTMMSLTSDSKICNVCRHLYTKWKKENPEFSSFITRLEGDMIDDSDIDGISVNIFSVSLNISMLFVY